jgi:hypothetical protein
MKVYKKHNSDEGHGRVSPTMLTSSWVHLTSRKGGSLHALDGDDGSPCWVTAARAPVRPCGFPCQRTTTSRMCNHCFLTPGVQNTVSKDLAKSLTARTSAHKSTVRPGEAPGTKRESAPEARLRKRRGVPASLLAGSTRLHFDNVGLVLQHRKTTWTHWNEQ